MPVYLTLAIGPLSEQQEAIGFVWPEVRCPSDADKGCSVQSALRDNPRGNRHLTGDVSTRHGYQRGFLSFFFVSYFIKKIFKAVKLGEFYRKRPYTFHQDSTMNVLLHCSAPIPRPPCPDCQQAQVFGQVPYVVVPVRHSSEGKSSGKTGYGLSLKSASFALFTSVLLH